MIAALGSVKPLVCQVRTGLKRKALTRLMILFSARRGQPCVCMHVNFGISLYELGTDCFILSKYIFPVPL